MYQSSNRLEKNLPVHNTCWQRTQERERMHVLNKQSQKSVLWGYIKTVSPPCHHVPSGQSLSCVCVRVWLYHFTVTSNSTVSLRQRWAGQVGFILKQQTHRRHTAQNTSHRHVNGTAWHGEPGLFSIFFLIYFHYVSEHNVHVWLCRFATLLICS